MVRRTAVAAFLMGISLAMAGVDASVSAEGILCGYYDGTRVCTPILRTGPKKPTTSKGMIARATPKSVEVGSSVKLWMGPTRGNNGFASGELVRFFDIYKARTSEMTGVQNTLKGGIARWSREYLSLPGVDPTGTHHLCGMGERTGKIACVRIEVIWGGSGKSDDSYGGVAAYPTSTTIASTPATTTAPATTTTVGGFTPPKSDGGFSAPSAG